MNEYEFEKVIKFIDDSARVLVGTLLKRVEVLDKEKSLKAELYKSLTKELIYENSRQLKKLLEVYFKIGKIEFKSKPNHSKNE